MRTTVTNAKPLQKGRGLSEKQVGYLMILPALIVILVIAIWPVIRSFYLSGFDLRLNDPTKREAFVSYNINVATYADNYKSFLKTMDAEIRKSNGNTKNDLSSLKTMAMQSHQLLASNPDFLNQYEQVRNLLSNLQPVPQNMEYFKIPKATATTVIHTYDQIGDGLTVLQSKDLLYKPKDVIGSYNIVRGAIISPNFIGFDNYKRFLNDARMWRSLWNTVSFTVISVAIELVLGFLIAMLINKSFRGRGLVRAAVLIPWAIPTVISAKMWLFMYNGEYGIMAKFFQTIGLIPNMGILLTDRFWQMFSVIFADVWKTTPFMALLLLAGLQTIPSSLYEAAEVDGATKMQQFAKITMPLMKSSILVAVLFRTLDAFRIFDLIYVLLGRSQSSEVISTYAYQTMFAQTEFGAGSTLAVIVFICVAIISIGFIKLLGSELIEDKR